MGTAVLVSALLLSGTDASAHAFGSRYDLPLPLGFYAGAAALAVAASFLVALAVPYAGSGRSAELRVPVPPAVARVGRNVLAALGITTLVVLLTTAALGPEEVTRNFGTVFVWVIWWVGFLLISAVVVVIWPALDPFRSLTILLTPVLGRRLPSRLPGAAGYLAPAGLLFLAWVELVPEWSENPRALAVLICCYGVTTIGMGAIFGTAWFRTADPLSRTFELLGRLAIVRPRAMQIAFGLPGEGLLIDTQRQAGEVALVSVLIGVVLFDGLSETPFWAAILEAVSQSQSLRGTLLFLRGAGVDLLGLIKTLGMLDDGGSGTRCLPCRLMDRQPPGAPTAVRARHGGGVCPDFAADCRGLSLVALHVLSADRRAAVDPRRIRPVRFGLGPVRHGDLYD